ncbi:hypothetical protein ACQPZP_34185 [Spirillospora sp. CA-142024]|uniref:hypothetical protein n=1 Tax=Spirillospora sp. CA-142024 TaxID=3240036 RepID=UPI003D93C7E8
MHLDFGVDDLATADCTTTDAGATRLRPTDEITPETRTGSRVYASPAGHPSACARPEPAAVHRAAPVVKRDRFTTGDQLRRPATCRHPRTGRASS